MESIIDKVMEYLRERSWTKLGELMTMGIDVPQPTQEVIRATDIARRGAVDLVLDAVVGAGMTISDKEHLQREFAKKDEQTAKLENASLRIAKLERMVQERIAAIGGLNDELIAARRQEEVLNGQVEHWKKKYQNKIFAND